MTCALAGSLTFIIFRHPVSISTQFYRFSNCCAKLVKGWSQAHCEHERTVWVDTRLKYDAHGISARIPGLYSFQRAHRGSCKLPQAYHLPDVSKRQSCHVPCFNTDRNASCSSHHRFPQVLCLWPILACDAIRSCLCSQVGGDVCILYMRPCRLANFHCSSSSCVNISTTFLIE